MIEFYADLSAAPVRWFDCGILISTGLLLCSRMWFVSCFALTFPWYEANPGFLISLLALWVVLVGFLLFSLFSCSFFVGSWKSVLFTRLSTMSQVL